MIDATRAHDDSILPKETTLDQAKDTGQAMVLLCLLILIFTGRQQFAGIAIAVLVINMTCPKLFKPAARWWFGLSHLLGKIVPRILLSILFFALVTPVGLLRRVLGADPLQLRKWKKGRDSVLRNRDHIFTEKDISNPF